MVGKVETNIDYVVVVLGRFKKMITKKLQSQHHIISNTHTHTHGITFSVQEVKREYSKKWCKKK